MSASASRHAERRPYGGATLYHGSVIGLAPGTGSAFALLRRRKRPATGSRSCSGCRWRIRLDPRELAATPLRVGLSMNVSIDTHDRSGPVLAKRPFARGSPGDESVRARARRRRTARARDRPSQPGAKQRRGGPRNAVAMAPLTPRQRAILTRGAVARGFHERARPRDRECRDPAARGRARHERGPGYLGDPPRFAVSAAIAMPLTGWLGRRYGEVRVFLVCTAMFTVASLACGLSSNLAMLIAMRAIQGVFGGPMIPLSQSLLLNNYPTTARASRSRCS